MKMALENILAVSIAEEVQEIVAKETRRALHDHEDRLTTLVRAAVASAIAELLNGREAA
jgi:hypothetical protein